MPRILIADDQPDVLDALRLLLKTPGHEVVAVRSPEAILSEIVSHEADLLIMDLNYTRDTTSGREGLDLLPKIKALDPNLPVVVMTAWGAVSGAVEAMKRGATDYVEKPWDDDRLLSIIRSQLELGRARRQAERAERVNERLGQTATPVLIAESSAMRPVLEVMERIAPSDANVLITGEHGTGKEVVAQWIHGSSLRAGKPLIPVNAGGISEGVFESELFGHVKGAFTDAKNDRVGCFELAHQGTLFLDEIANLEPKLQAKMLRVLQTGEFQRVGSSRPQRVDVRVLSATNADIRGAIAAGHFREDLLYRLNTVEIRLPPLRERQEDIPLLASHFLAEYIGRYRKPIQGFDSSAAAALVAHAWPGNVRELAHTVERAVLMARGNHVSAADLGLHGTGTADGNLAEMTMDEAERFIIKKALARHSGNVNLAAESLGMSRSALYRRLQQYEEKR